MAAGAPLPWIDTHCHLDAREFAADRQAVIDHWRKQGVQKVVIPAVELGNFATVQALARSTPGGRYALGIHPLYSAGVGVEDLARLDAALSAARDDRALVAVGEIGLDLFVEAMRSEAALAHQEWLLHEQLKLARHHGLPVLLHIRRAQDRVLKALRSVKEVGGIAHAFNGSAQQAGQFASLGVMLGLGGAMTFPRALNIRRIARAMPLETLVLETDAPDLAPAWRADARNTPSEIPAIGACLAELRGLPLERVAEQTALNAKRVLPRL